MSYEYLILSFILFSLSLLLFFRVKNLIMMLISIELILNALNIAIANIGFIKESSLSYIFIIFMFAIIAAESAIGLAIIILVSKNLKTIDIDLLSFIKDKYK
ncbi:MAG: NADH-quinone oxidoreductase subunit NuoK [Elusimicrobiota bacterium]